MLQARYVARGGRARLLEPDSEVWRVAQARRIALIGAPLGLQPTDAIRATWAKKKIGAVGQVRVAALHDGRELALRLEWEDPDENREVRDTTAFPDGAAVVFPAGRDAPLVTMGAPGAAVNAWYWRADQDDRGRDVVAEGIGTSRTVDQDLVRTRGVWKDGRWRVVIARALRVDTAELLVQLRPGETTRFGVAVWDGGRGERAGIKAFSGDWRELVLEARG